MNTFVTSGPGPRFALVGCALALSVHAGAAATLSSNSPVEVDEDVVTASVSITVTDNGATIPQRRLTVATDDGTALHQATAGSDYVSKSETVSFTSADYTNGVYTHAFTVTVTDDAELEPEERIDIVAELEVFDAATNTWSDEARRSGKVFIEDDETALDLAFDARAGTAVEGSSFSVGIKLADTTETCPVSFDVVAWLKATDADGHDYTGDDYEVPNTVVALIPACARTSTNTLDIPIVDDADDDEGEQVSVLMYYSGSDARQRMNLPSPATASWDIVDD